VASYTNFQFFDFGGITRLLEPLTGVSSYNLLNTPMTFVLPAMFGCGLRSGLFIFIFRQFFAGIPQELDEAARIDGCGPLRTFIRIMVPMAVPAFITTCLFSAVWHWNDMYTMGMYFTTEIRPITPTLADLTAAMLNDNIINHVGTTLQVRSYFAAASLLTVLPPLLLYVVLQRHFTESIEKTGIVG
jgi:multiple sugar transport system permease protein